MSQAIKVETKAEQQGLTLLREQGVAEGASRELTLYPEQRLDQRSAPVEPLRKSSVQSPERRMQRCRAPYRSQREGNREAPSADENEGCVKSGAIGVPMRDLAFAKSLPVNPSGGVKTLDVAPPSVGVVKRD